MLWIDLAILGFTLLMAVWGYSRGVLTAVLLVIGFTLGGLVGSRVGGLVLEGGATSPVVTAFALVGAILVGALLGLVGGVLRSRRPGPVSEPLRVCNGLGGALLLACLGLAVVWLLAGVTKGQRPDLRPAQTSRVLATLDAALPPSRPILNALAIHPVPPPVDPVPNIWVEAGPRRPRADLADPERGLERPDPAVTHDRHVRAAGSSVVRVRGTACGRGVQGSGWVAKNGVVVTNAHIVAGQRDTRVELRDGTRHDAEAIWYEPKNDLAVLRSSGVASAGVRPLRLRLGSPPGTAAAILGYPGGGPYRTLPGRLGPTKTVLAQDSYGRGPLERRVSALRGKVRPGNSGGPVVDRAGRVVTTVMLASLSKQRARRTPLGVVNGFGIPAAIAQKALARAGERVGTGPCPH